MALPQVETEVKASKQNRKHGQERWCISQTENSKKYQKEQKKTVLFRSGLGLRRITANLNFTAEQLFNAIEDIYTKHKGSGGLEFLRCGQNCRDLQVID